MHNYSIDPLERIEEVIHSEGSLITNRKPDGFMAQCPAHDDRNPSLSVKRGQDGKVLVHCFAGCTIEAICSALGIEVHDLFSRSTTPEVTTLRTVSSSRAAATSIASATPSTTERASQPYPYAMRSEEMNTVYQYFNAEGDIAYENVRIPLADGKKDFRLRRYDLDGNLIWNLDNVRQIPYGLPELLANPNDVIHATEGEKDTITLRARSILAVSLSEKVLKHPELDQWFRDRHIVLHADNDKTGLNKANTLAKSLYPFVATIRMIEYAGLPNNGDVTDYLEGGYGSIEDLIERCNSAPIWHPHSAPPTSGLKIRKGSEITPLDIDWLWERWLPSGMVTLFAGYGGSGKSTTALAIATALTTAGALPDGSAAPLTNVLILAAEDSPEYTLVPRLIELGADLERVYFADGVLRDDDVPGWIQLREHIPLIEAEVLRHSIGLVIIDPVSSYIGDGNGDRESDVRSALMPVVQMAKRTGVAVLMIRHVSKSGDSNRAASRILGSTAWADVPRVAWMLADAPDSHQPEADEGGTRDVCRVLGVAKSNLTAKPGALWGIQPADGPFRWLPELSPVSIEECFRQPSGDSASKVDEAMDWLRHRLAGGMERARSIESAALDAGISKRTLERARATLKVTKRKDKDGWWMGLPPAEPASDQGRQTASTDKTGGFADDGEQNRHLLSYAAVGGVDAPINTAKMAELAIFPQSRREFDKSESDSINFQGRQLEPDRANPANSRAAKSSGKEHDYTVVESDETGEWSITL